jgi:hypothetical protein
VVQRFALAIIKDEARRFADQSVADNPPTEKELPTPTPP